jgi:hypothetical protein
VLHGHAAAEAAGLNATDFFCLTLLELSGPLTAGQLAQQTGLTTGATTLGRDDQITGQRQLQPGRETRPVDRGDNRERGILQRVDQLESLGEHLPGLPGGGAGEEVDIGPAAEQRPVGLQDQRPRLIADRLFSAGSDPR